MRRQVVGLSGLCLGLVSGSEVARTCGRNEPAPHRDVEPAKPPKLDPRVQMLFKRGNLVGQWAKERRWNKPKAAGKGSSQSFPARRRRRPSSIRRVLISSSLLPLYMTDKVHMYDLDIRPGTHCAAGLLFLGYYSSSGNGFDPYEAVARGGVICVGRCFVLEVQVGILAGRTWALQHSLSEYLQYTIEEGFESRPTRVDRPSPVSDA